MKLGYCLDIPNLTLRFRQHHGRGIEALELVNVLRPLRIPSKSHRETHLVA